MQVLENPSKDKESRIDKKKKAAEKAQKRPEISEEEMANEIKELEMTNTEWIAAYLKRMDYGRYVRLMQSPGRIFWMNLLGGIGRGFGFAVGFSILGFLAIALLRALDVLNLPLIGDFITQLLEYIQMNQGARV